MLLPGVEDQEADVEAHRVWKCGFAPPGNNRAANLMVRSRDMLQGTHLTLGPPDDRRVACCCAVSQYPGHIPRVLCVMMKRMPSAGVCADTGCTSVQLHMTDYIEQLIGDMGLSRRHRVGSHVCCYVSICAVVPKHAAPPRP
jgi:hypothetical protein